MAWLADESLTHYDEMTKIVFILGSLHMQRCMKRIDEFVEHGFEVDAYGFDCGLQVKVLPKAVKISVLGKMNLSWGYSRRVPVLYKGLRNVLKEQKGKNVIFYIFGLDKSMLFHLMSRKPYIYEESDLVHTYMSSRYVANLFEWIDKRVIRKSLISVFTSEGFLNYHYGDYRPDNTFVIANRLPPSVLNLPEVPKKAIDASRLSVGFVGFIRFRSIFNFAKIVGENFSSITFHFFGTANNEADRQMFESLHAYQNIIFHGAFKSPTDLPSVYSQLDLVLSTYDVENENVRYAEPNKIYEAIFFKTPIIVSKGTFLADKVQRLGIGFEIDPMDDRAVESFLNSLDEKRITEKKDALQNIDRQIALNFNDEFFARLKGIIK